MCCVAQVFKLVVDDDIIKVGSASRPKAIERIVTSPYPAFPTDLQSQVMVLLALADGVSVMKETIFEGRFKHVDELCTHGCGYSGGYECGIYPRRSETVWRDGGSDGSACRRGARHCRAWPRKGRRSWSRCIISTEAMIESRRCSGDWERGFRRYSPVPEQRIQPDLCIEFES